MDMAIEVLENNVRIGIVTDAEFRKNQNVPATVFADEMIRRYNEQKKGTGMQARRVIDFGKGWQ